MTTTSPVGSAPAATMTTMTASVQRGATHPSFWRRLGYELSGLPMAVASFSFVLAATIAGIVLSWTVVGLPVLAFALLLAGGFASIERRRLGWLEGAQPPAYYRMATSGGSLRRSWTIIKDPQRWRDLVHAMVIFPIRIFSFVVSIVLPVAGAGGTLYILWEWSLPRGGRDQTLAELIGLGSSRSADIALTTGIGLVLLVASPFVIRGLATMDAGLARALS